ncbi:MAG: phosphopantothenoylcysteine decarboxylase [Victivallales bacterium]|nr:phosphopantothenoylcysteine decarboxylase [Victivallales bacterium]
MKILISAGPTREKLDIIRFFSNRSSGKMGYALATAAAARGFEAVLVSGPVNLEKPANVRLIKVESAAEMAAAVKAEAATAALVIMAAAVADFTPAETFDRKLKKTSGEMFVRLKPTEDILYSLGQHKPAGQTLVGFAAESEDVLANAGDKMRRKNLDWIIANDISNPESGFAVDVNAVTMISRDGRNLTIPSADKKIIAEKILQVLLPAQ